MRDACTPHCIRHQVQVKTDAGVEELPSEDWRSVVGRDAHRSLQYSVKNCLAIGTSSSRDISLVLSICSPNYITAFSTAKQRRGQA